jgi:hypothetical protein
MCKSAHPELQTPVALTLRVQAAAADAVHQCLDPTVVNVGVPHAVQGLLAEEAGVQAQLAKVHHAYQMHVLPREDKLLGPQLQHRQPGDCEESSQALLRSRWRRGFQHHLFQQLAAGIARTSWALLSQEQDDASYNQMGLPGSAGICKIEDR